MNGRDFLDTNVLVYAYERSNPDKKQIARELVRRAVAGEFVISTQVLAEFASTLLHKVQPAISFERVIEELDVLAPIPVILPDAGIVRRAVDAQGAFGVHVYDGMIIAAAERAGSKTIWSEDLNPGQKYFGVNVVNPFR